MSVAFGLDLNGLWDFACRREGEEEARVQDLGIRGSLVRLEAGENAWIGGLEAGLAPHGRGAAWGEIGAQRSRIYWFDVLSALADRDLEPEQRKAVLSFLDRLFAQRSAGYVTVPDSTSFDEAARDGLLRLLAGTRHLHASLLWRPIAAALGWLALPDAERGAEPAAGMPVAILSLMADGLQISVVRLIDEDGLWVPERSAAGFDAGGWNLRDDIIAPWQAELSTRLPCLDKDIIAGLETPWQDAIVGQRRTEFLRTPGHGWRPLPSIPCPQLAFQASELPDDLRCRLDEAQALIVEGPLAGNRQLVASVLEHFARRKHPVHCGRPDLGGRPDLAASGCLAATERSRNGQPVYYDFLPQLEINAMVGDQPDFVELIPRQERLPGGKAYRGQAPERYRIDRNAIHLDFYLFKEDAEKGRKARVPLPEKAESQHDIIVSVEQHPGQGFAKVSVKSDSFEALRRQPIELDWSAMEGIEDTREAVLEALSGQSGLAYPDVAVTEGHPLHWHPEHPKGNLLKQIDDYLRCPLFGGGKIKVAGRKALQILRERFAASDRALNIARKISIDCEDRGNYRALSSDGQLPPSTDEFANPCQAGQQLEAALAKAARELREALGQPDLRGDKELLGDLIGFASWCFWRCPETAVDFVLETYANNTKAIHHILLRQSPGRIIHREADMRRYFATIATILTTGNGLNADEFAALARVLGTSEQAADVLEPSTADLVLQATLAEIERANRQAGGEGFKRRFNAAMRMLTGLLRHRRINAAFLDPDASAGGRKLLKLLEQSLTHCRDLQETMQRRRRRMSDKSSEDSRRDILRFVRTADIIDELIAQVHREGKDPNIIRKLEALDE